MATSLVYHAGALGDFITTLPAMSAWRRLHPAERIVLLGKAAHGDLAHRGIFDEVWEAGSSQFAPLFGAEADLVPGLRERFSTLRSALLFCSASSRLPSNLALLGAAAILRQDPFPTEKRPVIDYHLSLFPRRAFSAEDRLPQVSRSPAARAVPSATAALHPGSGDAKKNWPREKFEGLAGRLKGEGCAVRWVLGPAEEEFSLPKGSEAWRNVPLPELASLLSVCEVFVGNDSGIAHLAAAVGCPTVALFGASDPDIWAPYGPIVQVIKAPRTLASLSGEVVFSACRDFLKR
jgi:heptosyltransferase-3